MAKNERRKHLGASEIGQSCSRKIWLNFRYAKQANHAPKVQRIFERGKSDELRFINYFNELGCDIQSVSATDGRQFSFTDFGGHFSGSIDGVIKNVWALDFENNLNFETYEVDETTGIITTKTKKIDSITEAVEKTKKPFLFEFKTHNSKNFNVLKSYGLKEKFESHFAQVQVYLYYFDLTHALYVAVNKDNDELVYFLVPANSEIAKKYISRAEAIIFKNEAPKIYDSPGWWECKFCLFSEICHSGAVASINCRTCIFAAPLESGGWICEYKSKRFYQPNSSCVAHIFYPEMVGDSKLLKTKLTKDKEYRVELETKNGGFLEIGHGAVSSRALKKGETSENC